VDLQLVEGAIDLRNVVVTPHATERGPLYAKVLRIATQLRVNFRRASPQDDSCRYAGVGELPNRFDADPGARDQQAFSGRMGRH
jgi:hypothetical protein